MKAKSALSNIGEVPFMVRFQESVEECGVIDGKYDDDLQVWSYPSQIYAHSNATLTNIATGKERDWDQDFCYEDSV